jgi:hypothetical protein
VIRGSTGLICLRFESRNLGSANGVLPRDLTWLNGLVALRRIGHAVQIN